MFCIYLRGLQVVGEVVALVVGAHQLLGGQGTRKGVTYVSSYYLAIYLCYASI